MDMGCPWPWAGSPPAHHSPPVSCGLDNEAATVSAAACGVGLGGGGIGGAAAKAGSAPPVAPLGCWGSPATTARRYTRGQMFGAHEDCAPSATRLSALGVNATYLPS